MRLLIPLIGLAAAQVPEGWNRRKGVYCTQANQYKVDNKVWINANPPKAVEMCNSLDNCVGIYDWECDGKGLRLCMKSDDDAQVLVGREGMCTYLKPGTEDEVCHDVTDMDECYGHILWSMDTGRVENPQWYSDMKNFVPGMKDLQDATVQDFQQYFFCKPQYDGKKHRCGGLPCGRSCPKPTNNEPTAPPSNPPSAAPKPKLTINPRTGYGRRQGRVCWSAGRIMSDKKDDKGNPVAVSFTSAEKAVTACDVNDDCIGITDFNCDGTGLLYLCKKGEDTLKNHGKSCTYMKPGVLEQTCHKVSPLDDCFNSIRWAKNTGSKNNPQWYEDFQTFVPGVELADATFDDWQQYFFCHPRFPDDDPEKRQNCGLGPCGRTCPVLPTPAPTSEPKGYTSDWPRRRHLSCWANNQIKNDKGESLGFNSIDVAVAECAKREDCSGVSDYMCDGGVLRLCKKGKQLAAAKDSCVFAKPGTGPSICHDVGVKDACYNHIKWAMDTGRDENPQWYENYKSFVDNPPASLQDLTMQDFQMYFHCNEWFQGKPANCGAPVCGRKCPETATKPPTEEPTEAPKDVVVPTVAEGYGRDKGVICWKDSRIKNDKGEVIMFADVADAIKECDKNEQCMGLADFNCDGTGNWAMCAVGKPMASAAAHCTYQKKGRVDQLCHELTEQDDCYNDVLWAMENGRENNPEWYNDFAKFVPGVALGDATALDFQMYFHCKPSYDDKRHNCGLPVCGRKCPVQEKDNTFPVVEGWSRRSGIACWDNRIMSDEKNDKGELQPLRFYSPAVAIAECEKRDDCQAIFDWNCDSQGGFILCKDVKTMVGAPKKHCSYIDSRYQDDFCHDVMEMDACYSDVMWALDNYKERDDLYKTFNQITGKDKAKDVITKEDFQLFFFCNPWFKENGKSHVCAAKPCNRECMNKDDPAPEPTPEPTPAPKQEVDYKGWNRNRNLYCWSTSRMKTDEKDDEGNPKDLVFKDLNDAIIRCAQEDECIGVSDWNCDDGGLFFLCTGRDKPISRRGDCLYMKPTDEKDGPMKRICHDADPRDDCYGDVKWALDTGRFEHPEWYDDFDQYVPDRALKDANFQDMQMYFHCHPDFDDRQANCGAPVCGRKCGKPGYLTVPNGYTRKNVFCTQENRIKDDKGEVMRFPGVFAAAAACNARDDCIGLADYECDGGSQSLCKKDGELVKAAWSCSYMKPGVDVEKCHSITPLDVCYLDVEWAYTTGRHQEPDNYKDFSDYVDSDLKEASFQDMQLYFFCHGAFRDKSHNCGYPPCGKKCLKRDMSGTKAPTKAPVEPQTPKDTNWGRREGVACWQNNQVMTDKKDDKGNPISMKFNKIDEAVDKCKELGDGCAGVFDWNCDGTGQFSLCAVANKIASKEGMCVYVKPEKEAQLCHVANQLDDCWGHIAWAVDNEKGIKNNDESGWFDDFKQYVPGEVELKDASYEDLQLYFHCKFKFAETPNPRNCGLPPCGRQCRPQPQIPTEKGWNRRHGHMCWSNNWVSSGKKDDKGKDIAMSFDKIDAAMKKCDELGKDVCGGVTDWSCDARPAFKLCGAGNHVQKGVDKHCVWVKGAYKEEKCHDISPLDTCFSHVNWALNEGRNSNPEWYKDFNDYVGGVSLKEANADHFQLYFHCKTHNREDPEQKKGDCGAPPCGDFKCKKMGEDDAPPAPTKAPFEPQLPDVKEYGRRVGNWCPQSKHIKKENQKGEMVSWWMPRDLAVAECNKREDCMGLGDWMCDGNNYVMCTTTDYINNNDACMYVKHSQVDEVCHDTTELDDCHSHISWALNTGRKNNPNWYPEFEKVTGKKLEANSVTLEDMQMWAVCMKREGNANCKIMPCGRTCPVEDPGEDDDTYCKLIGKKNQCDKNIRCMWKNDVCQVDKEASPPTGKDLSRFCKGFKKESDCDDAPWGLCAYQVEPKKRCIPKADTPAPTAAPCSPADLRDKKFTGAKTKTAEGNISTDCECRDACRAMANDNPKSYYKAYLFSAKKGKCECVRPKKAPKNDDPVKFKLKNKKKLLAGPLDENDDTIFE